MTGRRSHGRLSALNGVVHQGSLLLLFKVATHPHRVIRGLAHELDPALSLEPPTSMAQKTLPWLVLGGFVCSAASLLAAL